MNLACELESPLRLDTSNISNMNVINEFKVIETIVFIDLMLSALYIYITLGL